MRKKIFKLFLLITMIAFAIVTLKARNQNKAINAELKDFIADKKLIDELSNDYFKYYSVSRGTYTDIFADEDYLYPGMNGEILVSLEPPIQDIPLAGNIFAFYFGGHAAVSYGAEVIDVTGNFLKAKDMKVKRAKNQFLTQRGLKSFIGLKVVNPTENDLNLTKEFYEKQIGKKYNFTFFFQRDKKYYCTDLIYQAWNIPGLSRDYNLSKSKQIISVQNIILSEDTEIFIYKYVDKDYVTHIYF